MGNNICIYGCGINGIKTYLLLREQGINIRFFGDRDKTKQGYVVDGLTCKSYDEILQTDKKNTLLIVAVVQGEKLCAHFQDLGFEQVVYYKNILPLLHSGSQKAAHKPDPADIRAMKELKHDIEKLACRRQIPPEVKRDHMLRLLERQGK